MRILGIGDGFGAGIALVEDGARSLRRERGTPLAHQEPSGYYHGFPERSLRCGFEATGWAPEAIDRDRDLELRLPAAAVASARARAQAPARREGIPRASRVQPDAEQSALQPVLRAPLELASGARLDLGLPGGARQEAEEDFGLVAPIVFVDHHRNHAASAYFTQPEDDCIVFTLDCHGDGLSGSVSLASKGRIERIAAFPARDSIGSFYAAITHHLGFKHHRHEGKVTGLAAYADPNIALADMQRMISYDPASGRIQTQLGRNQFASIANIGSFFSRAYTREEIAAAAQAHLEHLVLAIVRQHLQGTGRRKLLLAGGIFGNVKLNQRINQLDEAEYLFVHPGMGDEGLPVGAALACSAELGSYELARIQNVYWGPGFDDAEAERALAGSGFAVERVPDITQRVAELLAAHKIVARCSGRMEYGPRSLGHRSILYHAGDPSANDWLNHKLRRSEFMPFAPATLASHAAACYRDLASAAYAAEFMTVCFDVEPEFRKQCPAVVHVDGTARPQLVTEASHPDFHRILSGVRAPHRNRVGRQHQLQHPRGADRVLSGRCGARLHDRRARSPRARELPRLEADCGRRRAMSEGRASHLKRRAETRAHYDRYPFRFDQRAILDEKLENRLMGAAILALPGTDALVLDVGCGACRVAHMVRSVGKGRVIGVDLSLETLRAARSQNPDPVVNGDNTQLPLRTGVADLVISNGVIMVTPDARASFRELARVTRPGGTLVVSVYDQRSWYYPVYRYGSPLVRRLATGSGTRACASRSSRSGTSECSRCSRS